MELFFSIIDILLISCFFKALFIRKENKYLKIYQPLYSLIFVIFMSITLYNFILHAVVFTILLLLLASSYKGAFSVKIQMILVLILVYLIGQLMGKYAFDIFVKTNTDANFSLRMGFYVEHTVCEVIRFILIGVIIYRGRMDQFSLKIRLCLIMIVFMGIVQCIIQYHTFFPYGYSSSYFYFYYFLFNTFVCILIFNLLSYFHDLSINHMENLLTLQEMEYKENYYKEIEKNNSTLRKVRHDIKNQLIAIEAISREDVASTSDEIQSLICEMEREYKNVISNNIALNEICSRKFLEAIKSEIEIEYDVQVPKDLKLKSYETGVLYGHLLDNAIEASLLLDREDRKIHLMTFIRKGCLIIHMKNRTMNVDSTCCSKKTDPENHGFGLKSVKEIINKYDGLLDVKISEGIFEIKIMLCDVLKTS